MLDNKALQQELLDLFDKYGVSVAVGLTANPAGGVAILSQDERVQASNVGIAKPQSA